MLKNLIKVKLIMLLGLGIFITSCSKEELGVEVENYGFTESYEMQKSLNAGRHGCLELVFPISVTLPDSTVLEFDSFEQAKEELQAWKEANPDVEGRPQLVFPVEVITQDGEVVSVNSKEEIKEIIRDCRGNFPPRPRHFRACFKLEFPVSVSFPEGDVLEVASKMELKQAIRNWKQDNPDAEERPELVFPVTIVYEDGSTAEINSKEELIEAKKACREE